METLKIIAMCALAAILYGEVHDQVTARVCLEYFTIFHPYVPVPQTATWLALVWGVLATWWVGVILGTLLAFAARGGKRIPMTARELVPMVAKLLLVMAMCATVAGLLGYFFYPLYPYDKILQPERQHRFFADWWTHAISYASGLVGGLVLCFMVWKRREPIQRSGL